MAALLALALVATACAPAASWLRDRLDSGEGATLTFVERGVQFDPGGATAYGVHITLRGENLEFLDGPDTCEVNDTAQYLDCSMAAVHQPVTVHLTGKGVLGSATYTRTPDSLAWLWAYTPVD
ncbi:MAG: hypothetical protein LC118_15625 [Dehalococcoidia bacterium]|nr:hypothetical protein [Dehalococcoidia bacterium]